MGDTLKVLDPLQHLMAAAQAGDRAAYSRLLSESASIARRVILRRHPYLSGEDREDLVQDILLSLHTARATYSPGRPYLPWLIAIIRNRVADAARRHVRQRAWQVAAEDTPETLELAETNSGKDAAEDAEELRQAVARLPESQRTAIELTKLQELSLQEAAARSGMTVSALKIAGHRAMKALRGLLGPSS